MRLKRKLTGQMRVDGEPSKLHIMRRQPSSLVAGNSGSWRSSSPMMQPTLHICGATRSPGCQGPCVCVCVCVRVRVCARACASGRVRMCQCDYVHVRMQTRKHACVHVRVRVPCAQTQHI